VPRGTVARACSITGFMPSRTAARRIFPRTTSCNSSSCRPSAWAPCSSNVTLNAPTIGFPLQTHQDEFGAAAITDRRPLDIEIAVDLWADLFQPHHATRAGDAGK